MKIRAQLVLACFLLSVLPLSVIVIYSYRSSRSALESAYRKEADARTRQMDRRLATIRGDLQQRLAEVSALPIPAGATDRTPDVGNILLTMGDAASLVDSLEIQPSREFVAPQVRVVQREARVNPNAPPGVRQPPPPAEPQQQVAEAANADDESDAETPETPESPEPMVIGVGFDGSEERFDVVDIVAQADGRRGLVGRRTRDHPHQTCGVRDERGAGGGSGG